MFVDPRLPDELRSLVMSFNKATQPTQKLRIDVAHQMRAFAQRSGDPLHDAAVSLALGYGQVELGQYRNAIETAAELSEVWKRAGEHQILAEASLIEGMCHWHLNDIVRAKRSLERAIALVETDLFDPICGQARAILVRLALRAGAYSQAMDLLDHMHTSIDRLRMVAHDSWTCTIASILIDDARLDVYRHLQDHERALISGIKAYETAVACSNQRWIIELLPRIGAAYARCDRYAEAADWLEHAETIVFAYGDKQGIAACLRERASVYIHDDSCSDALAAIVRAEESCKTGADVAQYASILVVKSQCFVVMQHIDAPVTLHHALECAEQLEDRIILVDILRELYLYYRDNGYPDRSVAYADRCAKITDELYGYVREAIRREHDLRHRHAMEAVSTTDSRSAETSEREIESARQEFARAFSSLCDHYLVHRSLRRSLRKIVKQSSSAVESIREIERCLSMTSQYDTMLPIFEAELFRLHPTFTGVLIERYPALTMQEIKVCQLIRLGLKNHEIATILTISERSVESHRLNLRRKLVLSRKQTLVVFLEEMT